MRLACCPLPPFGHSLRRAERELRGTGRALPATGACSLLPFTGKVPEGRMGAVRHPTWHAPPPALRATFSRQLEKHLLQSPSPVDGRRKNHVPCSIV
ncbi:hypothetical protein CSC70_13855, partial [Pseudoxanthomonas kalamensis DSM 18571]